MGLAHAMQIRGQGAIELNETSFNCWHLAGQGATEYLVLLAVVLIVALVSVALLGFFPGMASDAQITQSQAYWKGASPVSVLETGATPFNAAFTEIYLKIRNSGAYPIRITKLLGYGGQSISNFCENYLGYCPNITDYYYMGPGEEKHFGYNASSIFAGLPQDREIIFQATASSTAHVLGGASTLCAGTGASAGTVVMKDFGFEYIEYIGGQQITKKEVGKPLIIRCR